MPLSPDCQASTVCATKTSMVSTTSGRPNEVFASAWAHCPGATRSKFPIAPLIRLHPRSGHYAMQPTVNSRHRSQQLLGIPIPGRDWKRWRSGCTAGSSVRPDRTVRLGTGRLSRSLSEQLAPAVAAGSRFRGGMYDGPPITEHHAGTPPVDSLTPDIQSQPWVRTSLEHVDSAAECPLRAPRQHGRPVSHQGDRDDALLYIDQGVLPNRPLAHLAKITTVGHSQGAIFVEQQRIEVSWVAAPQRPANQLLGPRMTLPQHTFLI